jgi:hypothetical protein
MRSLARKGQKMLEGSVLDIPQRPNFRLPQNVELTGRFGAHRSVLDLGEPGEFAAQLVATDLLAPEICGWNRGVLALYNRAAAGDIRAYQRLKGEKSDDPRVVYAKGMIDALFANRARLKVIALDVPESTLSKQVENAFARIVRSSDSRVPFTSAVERLHDLLVAWAVTNIRRWFVVLENLAPTIESAIAADRRLQGPRSVKALILMGAFHQGLGAEITSRQEELNVPGFTYRHLIQTGCENFGMQRFIDECRTGIVPSLELAARILVQNIVNEQEPYSDNEHSGIRGARIQEFVDGLTMTGLEVMYKMSK